MEPGLYVIQVAVNRYYAITLVGWLYRLHGDEYALAPGARVVNRRPGVAAEWDGIATLAENGPGDRYQLGRPMKTPEPMHRMMMQRPKPCLLPGWIEHVSKPPNWAQLTGETA